MINTKDKQLPYKYLCSLTDYEMVDLINLSLKTRDTSTLKRISQVKKWRRGKIKPTQKKTENSVFVGFTNHYDI